MPRTCSVCRHFQRELIDQELVAGHSLRNIAESYGTSATALFRHKKDHLPVALAKAREAEEVAQADTLLGKIQALEAIALRIVHKAEAKGDLATATRAIGQMRGILGLYPKVDGEVQAVAGRPMRNDNLLAIRKRRSVLTTDSDYHRAAYPNWAQTVQVDGIDQLWQADITFAPSDRVPAAQAGAGASFRSRGPIWLAGLRRAAGTIGRADLDEPPWKSLRQ